MSYGIGILQMHSFTLGKVGDFLFYRYTLYPQLYKLLHTNKVVHNKNGVVYVQIRGNLYEYRES